MAFIRRDNKALEILNLEYFGKNYGWLFKLHGSEIGNNRSNVCSKLMLFIRLIMMHFYLIYFICIHKVAISVSAPLYFNVLTACFISVGVCHIFRFKEKCLKKVIFKMNFMTLRHNLQILKYNVTNYLCLVIFCFSVCIISVNVYHIEYGKEKQKRIFTFNSIFYSYFAKITSRLCLFSCYFFTLYTFPAISSLFCCMIYYHLSTIISECRQKWKTDVQEAGKILSTRYIVKVLFYQVSCLIKLANKLDKNLSPIIFLLLSLQIVLLFG